jgi:hypothetical protein
MRQQQRDATADAAARAGDDGNFAGDHACHCDVLSRFSWMY